MDSMVKLIYHAAAHDILCCGRFTTIPIENSRGGENLDISDHRQRLILPSEEHGYHEVRL